MKRFNFILVLVLSTLLFSCENSSTEHSNKTDLPNQVQVIDFYGTHRCVTCKAIEANAKYTVETFFADEPRVVFKTVDVDSEENYEMAENYEATGTALVLNVIKDGEETHIDLTDFGFAKGREQEAFSKELKSKIETELKKL